MGLNCSPSLDRPAGLFPASSGQCGPRATDRSISSIVGFVVSGVVSPSCSERHSSEDANLLKASVAYMVDDIVDACAPRGRVEIGSGVGRRRRWSKGAWSWHIHAGNYLVGFGRVRFLRRTPGHPSSQSMNSTPAASNVRRTAESLAAVIDVFSSVNSARRIVVTPSVDWRARSSALQRRRARAALIWALVRGLNFILTYFISLGINHTERI